MFKYLITLIAVVLLPSFHALAELPELGKKPLENDIFYEVGGGARLRYLAYQNATGGGIAPATEDYSNGSHRVQLDLRIDKGEYFKTFFRAINSGEWGGGTDAQNEFILQQAWGQWNVEEILSFKFGRQAIEIGRGLTYGLNEWENLPTHYDGLSFLFDWSVMELSLHALRIHELDRIASSTDPDPQVSHYVIDLSFRDLSDIVQMADLYFIQVVSDVGQVPGTTALTLRERTQRFGLDLVLSGVYYQFSNSVAYVAGKKTEVAVEEKVKQLMLDTELRLILPDWHQFNFWAGYHYDSGDESADGESTQYDPLFYNIHQNAGRLDFFKFGNLTYLRGGLSMRLLSDYYFGAEYFMFDKTKAGAPNYLATSIAAEGFTDGTNVFGPSKNLGSELDIWAGKTFQSGVSLELGFNYLDPGSALVGTTVSGSAAPIDSPIYNIYVDVGMFF